MPSWKSAALNSTSTGAAPDTVQQFLRQLTSWWAAARPRTLTLAVSPVVAGTALGWAETSQLRVLPAAAALFAAVLIQVGTNLYNDAADFERGIDGPDRLGPPRATAQGWLSAAAVKRGALLCFALAFATGLYLAAVAGWEIFALGLLSLAAGYAYTAGPRPIAYGPTGELFVLAFFGLAAVGGSYYLQTGRVGLNALAVGVGLGLPAAAILLLNNYRDLDTDRRAGRRTLCHYLERPRARQLFAALLIVPLLLAWWPDLPGLPWLILAALPAALLLIRRLYRTAPSPALNAVLGNTAQYQLLLALLLSVGLHLAPA